MLLLQLKFALGLFYLRQANADHYGEVRLKHVLEYVTDAFDYNLKVISDDFHNSAYER